MSFEFLNYRLWQIECAPASPGLRFLKLDHFLVTNERAANSWSNFSAELTNQVPVKNGPKNTVDFTVTTPSGTSMGSKQQFGRDRDSVGSISILLNASDADLLAP
jgi:hypothetical protein